ncbi:phosphatase PAP2 family protein [Streptococcus dentiloxodontae]
MTYKERYERLSRPFVPYARQIALVNYCLTGVMYLIYPVLLLYLLWVKGWLVFLLYFLISGVTFVLLSFIRSQMNWKRPYEAWDIKPILVKEVKGNSMPSRHVFSASLISMAVISVSLWPGLFCLLVTLIIAGLRVIAGVHYPRDVLAGLVIGVVCGLLFWFVLVCPV